MVGLYVRGCYPICPPPLLSPPISVKVVCVCIVYMCVYMYTYDYCICNGRGVHVMVVTPCVSLLPLQ